MLRSRPEKGEKRFGGAKKLRQWGASFRPRGDATGKRAAWGLRVPAAEDLDVCEPTSVVTARSRPPVSASCSGALEKAEH